MKLCDHIINGEKSMNLKIYIGVKKYMLAKKAGNRSHRKVEKHDFYFAE